MCARRTLKERPKLLIARFLFLYSEEPSLYFRLLARAGLGTPDPDRCQRTVSVCTRKACRLSFPVLTLILVVMYSFPGHAHFLAVVCNGERLKEGECSGCPG